MKYEDYYDLMGVARDATQDDIKRAYRKLARKFHPDVSEETNAEQRFKEVGEAYDVLKDPEKRAAYDQLGANWQQGQEFRPPPDWNEGFEFSGGPDSGDGSAQFSEFFESLFGRQRGPRHPQGFGNRGEDHHARIIVDVRDSYSGATRSLSMHTPEVTDDGHVTTRDRVLNVRIPQGIREGQKIRLTGQGAPGLGAGKPGDLYLDVEFRSDPLYRVAGADVHLDLPITPWEAALGATVQVPIPSGPVDLKIPAGSNQGSKLRLKGKGLPGKEPGDLYVALNVILPPADSEEARSLYREMAQTIPFDPRANLTD